MKKEIDIEVQYHHAVAMLKTIISMNGSKIRDLDEDSAQERRRELMGERNAFQFGLDALHNTIGTPDLEDKYHHAVRMLTGMIAIKEATIKKYRTNIFSLSKSLSQEEVTTELNMERAAYLLALTALTKRLGEE